MISGSLTLLAVEDAEFSRIQLSTDTIVVDPYNVQTEPLVIKVELVSGTNVSSASAYLSTQAISIGNPISGAVKDFGLCSKAEFTIPAKDKLYAAATAIRVDSYSDAGKKNLIESKTVNVVCNQIPTPVSRGEKWMKETIFRNGDFLEHKVGNASSIYMWSSRVEGNTSKAPWDITLTTDPEYGYWEHVTEKTLFAAKILLAKSALVGSAVFNGDFMISQQGEAKVEGATYDEFEETMSKFTPNIMMNFLTGAAHFAQGNAKFNQDGGVDIRGRLEAVSKDGNNKVVVNPEKGEFNLYRKAAQGDEWSLVATLGNEYDSVNKVSRPILTMGKAGGGEVYNAMLRDNILQLLINDKSGLYRLIESAKNVGFEKHNSSSGGDTRSASFSADGMEFASYNNGSISDENLRDGVALNPDGLTFFSSDAYGNRVTKSVYPRQHKVVALTGGTYNVGADDFFIRTINGTNNVYLPPASTYPGRVIYFKKTSGGDYTYLKVDNKVNGGIKDENNSTSVKQYEINQNVALFVVSDATDWIVFYCG